MKPIAPLMMEHRLIERMLTLLDKEAERIDQEHNVDSAFIDTAMDFVRIYADKTHHAKEEDILFRDMAKIRMAIADHELMQELIADHQFGRRTVREIVDANSSYHHGYGESATEIAQKINMLTAFYRQHIQKEDNLFFPSSMSYLTQDEQESMLREFWEADRRMIHFKYRSLVEHLEGKDNL